VPCFCPWVRVAAHDAAQPPGAAPPRRHVPPSVLLAPPPPCAAVKRRPLHDGRRHCWSFQRRPPVSRPLSTAPSPTGDDAAGPSSGASRCASSRSRPAPGGGRSCLSAQCRLSLFRLVAGVPEGRCRGLAGQEGLQRSRGGNPRASESLSAQQGSDSHPSLLKSAGPITSHRCSAVSRKDGKNRALRDSLRRGPASSEV